MLGAGRLHSTAEEALCASSTRAVPASKSSIGFQWRPLFRSLSRGATLGRYRLARETPRPACGRRSQKSAPRV